ncbi:MAG: alkaline phosphatase D family protein [Janthinobacterium lividum]
MPNPESPALLLGPLLRYVGPARAGAAQTGEAQTGEAQTGEAQTGQAQATVWVEVNRPARVRVDVGLPDGTTVSGSSPTLTLHGHHFALVVVSRLPSGRRLPYEVLVDEVRLWPPRDPAWSWPVSEIRTPDDAAPLRLAFGSCRRAGDDGVTSNALVGVDALSALARRMASEADDEQRWPDLLLFVGDQVYADDPNPAIVERLRERHVDRRDADEEVRDEIGDFEEYTWLYHETWGHEAVRWLLSTVPTCMLLDDHDLRDDWNTSAAWRERVSALPWWRDRVTGAFASYWIYQHLGNLSPADLAEDHLLCELTATEDDTTRDRLLDEFARGADADPSSARWSFARDLGATRLLAIDSRCARRLEPSRRRITDAAEWDWLRAKALGQDRARPVEHLLLATTLPAFLLHGIHHAETFDEAVADGAWGRRAAGLAEKLRQGADLEHWAAFHGSFRELLTLLGDVASTPQPPSSVLLLSGDVHCSYTAQVSVPGVDASRTVIHQLVMSPFRNPLHRTMKMANRLLDTRPVRGFIRGLAMAAGVREPEVSWNVEHGPWFANGVMTVDLEPTGRADVEVDHAHLDCRGLPELRRTLTRRLSA